MTFPSGPGSFTNSAGPWLANSTAAIPDNTVANLGTGATTSGRTTTATQTSLSATAVARNTQQGNVPVVNASAVQLAGQRPMDVVLYPILK